MLCPRCNKNIATLRVTEVTEFHGPDHPDNEVAEEPLCEVCAQSMGLPAGASKGTSPAAPQIWKLLQMAQKGLGPGAALTGKLSVARKPSIQCPGCGLGLEELRRQGRVGCEQCYQAFDAYLSESLERLHGASRHVGRLPGLPEGELERRQQVEGLKGELQDAVREEDYERAADLRDEIQALESGAGRARHPEKDSGSGAGAPRTPREPWRSAPDPGILRSEYRRGRHRIQRDDHLGVNPYGLKADP